VGFWDLKGCSKKGVCLGKIWETSQVLMLWTFCTHGWSHEQSVNIKSASTRWHDGYLFTFVHIAGWPDLQSFFLPCSSVLFLASDCYCLLQPCVTLPVFIHSKHLPETCLSDFFYFGAFQNIYSYLLENWIDFCFFPALQKKCGKPCYVMLNMLCTSCL